MYVFIILAFIAGLLLFFVQKTYFLTKLMHEKGMLESTKNAYSDTQNYIYTGIIILILAGLVATYFGVAGTPWESHLHEWLNIVIRLMHITFGIAWIGASFYFVFLENALNRTEDVREELAGNLWAVHGGGFYYLEKYKVAPKAIPKRLHWFKYEAYFTWLTGISLLFVVYYMNANALLIDKNVLDLQSWQAIAIGIASFIVGWVVYDLLCKSPLIKHTPLFIAVGLLVVTAFALFYTHVFSSRAAFIHFGAFLGTLMAANVYFVIIPAQKAMVKAATEGSFLDPQLGKNALNRSLHNNYFTLPVLFVMVSNHFPSTFGYKTPWLVLMLITIGTAGVKHYLNLKEKHELSYWTLPLSVLVLLAAAFITAPKRNPNACEEQVSMARVNEIIAKRCTSCHSSHPTDDVYKVAPNGVAYDTPADIVKKKDLILQRVVLTKTMPQNNKTNMTDEERDLIRCWIEQGAPIE